MFRVASLQTTALGRALFLRCFFPLHLLDALDQFTESSFKGRLVPIGASGNQDARILFALLGDLYPDPPVGHQKAHAETDHHQGAAEKHHGNSRILFGKQE